MAIEDDDTDQLAIDVTEFIEAVNDLGRKLQIVLHEANPQPSVAIWTLLTLAVRIHTMYPPDGDDSNRIESTLEAVHAHEEHARAINNAKSRDPNN